MRAKIINGKLCEYLEGALGVNALTPLFGVAPLTGAACLISQTIGFQELSERIVNNAIAVIYYLAGGMPR